MQGFIGCIDIFFFDELHMGDKQIAHKHIYLMNSAAYKVRTNDWEIKKDGDARFLSSILFLIQKKEEECYTKTKETVSVYARKYYNYFLSIIFISFKLFWHLN